MKQTWGCAILQNVPGATAPSQLAAALEQARYQTDHLFSILSTRALYSRPIAERHRLIFYLGHLEAFDWNQICRAGLNCRSFQPEFDKLFEFGIDPEVGSTPTDKPTDWPETGEVLRYNQAVRRKIDALVADAPEELLNIALEHRLMHAETLAYLMHRVPLIDKVPQEQQSYQMAAPPKREMIDIGAGPATLGRRGNDGFGWDNEFEAHDVHVPAFRISRHMITNGDYLDYVREGGQPPPFWIAQGDGFLLSCMFEERPLPPDWPVYATWEQATGYAQWRGAALPSEAQWHRFASRFPEFPLGNYDFRRWDPEPVGDSPTGNGWHWTSTPFGPFKGFRPSPTYPGYSAKFFDGVHYVMKGAAPRTAARLARRTFRNWFRPDYPYMHGGFHLVENE